MSLHLASIGFVLTAIGCAVPPSTDELPVSDEPATKHHDPATPAEVTLTASAGGSVADPSGPGAGVGGTDAGGAAVPCPPGAAKLPWLCDGFEAAALDAAWSTRIQGGAVGPKKGGASGAASLGAGFATLPSGRGTAAVAYVPSASAVAAGAGLRFAVRVPNDGYPQRLGIGALRGVASDAFVLELDGGVHVVLRDTAGMGSVVSVGDLAFDTWTCVSIELDAGGKTVTATMPGVSREMAIDAARAGASIGSVEVGLTYDEGANANASIGLGFDDVVIGRGLTACR
jgi:hypothetical protein